MQDVVGSNFFDQLNIDKESEFRSRVFNGDMTPQTGIFQIKKSDGEVVSHQWVQRIIAGTTDHSIIIQSIGRDITDSKKTEDILRKFEYIFKYAGWGIVANEPRSLYFDLVNEAYAKMHGYKTEELVETNQALFLQMGVIKWYRKDSKMH